MMASSEWRGGTHFEGLSESGHRVLFDTGAEHRDGPSPMEMVLTALCACTSVDVVSILAKKRQLLETLVVSAEAEQAPEAPRVFTRIVVRYRVGGKALDRKAVEDAVALSKQRYCSVSIMLGKAVAIEAAIEFAAEATETEGSLV